MAALEKTTRLKPNVVPLRRGVLSAVAWSGWFG